MSMNSTDAIGCLSRDYDLGRPFSSTIVAHLRGIPYRLKTLLNCICHGDREILVPVCDSDC